MSRLQFLSLVAAFSLVLLATGAQQPPPPIQSPTATAATALQERLRNNFEVPLPSSR